MDIRAVVLMSVMTPKQLKIKRLDNAGGCIHKSPAIAFTVPKKRVSFVLVMMSLPIMSACQHIQIAPNPIPVLAPAASDKLSH